MFRSASPARTPMCEQWYLFAEPLDKDGVQAIEAGGFILRPILAGVAHGMSPQALYGELAKCPNLFHALYKPIPPNERLRDEGDPECLLDVELHLEMLKRAGIEDLFQHFIVPSQHLHVNHIAFRDGYATEENLALMVDNLVERFQVAGSTFGHLMTLDATRLMRESFTTDDGIARSAWVMSELGFVRFGNILVHRSEDETDVCDGPRRRRLRIASSSPKHTPL